MPAGRVAFDSTAFATTMTLALDAARDLAGAQAFPAPALYVVATPIGNVADIGVRALHVLALADVIACEDTRHTAPLLARYGIAGKALVSTHRHNEKGAAERVLERLARGERVALVSDAGTPALSDPGAAVVAAAHAAGHRVVPVPGPSSVLAALAACGDAVGAAAGGAFAFHGFLAPKGDARQAAIDRLAGQAATQIVLEAPHRIAALASALALRAPERAVTVCRELTKQFETVATMPAAALPAWLEADGDRTRGEFVVVLHARDPRAEGGADAAARSAALATLHRLLDVLPLARAVALAVDLTGRPKNELYAAALARKADNRDP